MQQTQKLKKERKGAQGARKVKTGCRTCRIRHKKCDEGRPSCSQCVRSGWECDLQDLQVITRTPHNPLPPPSSAVWGTTFDVQDVWDFEYFRVVCAKRISLMLRTDLWEKLILQAASTERAILDGAVALGALSRTAVPSKHISRPGVLPGHPAGYSLQKYNLALRGLRQRLHVQSGGAEVALLCSLIFVAFELENGEAERARMHLRSALAIVHDSRSALLSGTGDVAGVLDAFSQLKLPSSNGWEVEMSLPTLPPTFRNINDARDSLNVINGVLNSLSHQRACGSASHDGSNPRPSLAHDTWTLLNHLQSWRESFDATRKRLSADINSTNCVLVFLITYEILFITASTLDCSNETAYDTHLSRFSSIIQLAAKLLNINNVERVAEIAPAYCPKLNVAVVQPLFFVACKCRDGRTRREAAELLAEMRKAGFFDTRLQLKAAYWVMEIEKVNDGKGQAMGDVREADRLHDVRLDLDAANESCRVSGWKREADGRFRELVHIVYANDLEAGDVAGVKRS